MFSRAEMWASWMAFQTGFSTHPCGIKPKEMEQTSFSFVVRLPRFKPVIEKLDKVLEGIVYEAEFLKENDMSYIQITINRAKTNDIWLKTNSAIDQEYYHIEDLSKGEKTVLNIHVKGLNQMLDLINN